MRHTRRRRWDLFLLLVGAVAIGAAASIAALAGNAERIGHYWMHAALAGDSGVARVVEVIDYDYGPRSRRGILREIPDVDRDASITVSSPTAPDQLAVTGSERRARLRIGDPSRTVSGRHRYRIEYPLDTLVQGDQLSWDAVGLDWTVPIDNAEIHITAARQLVDPFCSRGGRGAIGGCDVTEVAPGHLVVEVSGLDSHEGVTVDATLGDRSIVAFAVPLPPTGPADDPGSGWLLIGLTGSAAALVGGLAVSRLMRWLGREQVWQGGAADAAFGPSPGTVAGVELIDHEQLAEMATIEFESPRGMSAVAGGIVYAEQVEPEHQVAWLLEAAIRGEVELQEDDGDFVLRRGDADAHPVVAARLAELFGAGERVELGKYDEAFALGWKHLGESLREWRDASPLWDHAARHRKLLARLTGALAGLAGLAGVIIGAIVANRTGGLWLALPIVGAALAGGGFAAVLRAWELPVRTPQGSARWLQVESFRRFIAASEARHAEAAARMGLLRHYTAWAVALDELDHWKDAVEEAATLPESAVSPALSDFRFVAVAPALSKATRQTYTQPSSSGGGGASFGGGFGGSVGGGGGGGGGGSW